VTFCSLASVSMFEILIYKHSLSQSPHRVSTGVNAVNRLLGSFFAYIYMVLYISSYLYLFQDKLRDSVLI